MCTNHLSHEVCIENPIKFLFYFLTLSSSSSRTRSRGRLGRSISGRLETDRRWGGGARAHLGQSAPVEGHGPADGMPWRPGHTHPWLGGGTTAVLRGGCRRGPKEGAQKWRRGQVKTVTVVSRPGAAGGDLATRAATAVGSYMAVAHGGSRARVAAQRRSAHVRRMARPVRHGRWRPSSSGSQTRPWRTPVEQAHRRPGTGPTWSG
jgi:hypothetical protein